jgi:hypothetical protein
MKELELRHCFLLTKDEVININLARNASDSYTCHVYQVSNGEVISVIGSRCITDCNRYVSVTQRILPHHDQVTLFSCSTCTATNVCPGISFKAVSIAAKLENALVVDNENVGVICDGSSGSKARS